MWTPDGRDRRSLGTADRKEAEQHGRKLQAQLVLGLEQRRPGGKVTLGVLWERYRTENPAFLDNSPTSKKDAKLRAKVLMAFFGADREVRTLTAEDQAAYAAARRAGGIRLSDKEGDVTKPVRARTVDADLFLLQSMLSWASRLRIGGMRWIESNPLQGVRRPREADPRRPVATWERYTATRAAMQKLAAEAKSEVERVRWVKMELALVLAQATGRRLGSIRNLRCEDLDFANGEIHWRAEHDKKRKSWDIPYPPDFWDEMRQFRRKLGVVGGWLFPGERMPDQPMDRHLFDKWLTVAEKAAGLPKLHGGLWHPYRRAWATARKDLPLKDVAAAGGWKDVETLLMYQQPDKETLMRVTSHERQVQAIVAGRG
ncbi:MAG: tyrosine-type recombinase/integrase [Gemmatimonadales bacterium]|nr:tyrosine-type recombinase/integrase [Gemmatimonadales bacterium]